MMNRYGGTSTIRVAAACAGTALLLAGCGSSKSSTSTASGGTAGKGSVLVGLITKTDTNPFFVTMKKEAQKEASKLGVTLQTYAGKTPDDTASQVTAIENLISAKAAGILLVANDSKAIAPAVEKARKAGILVMALDSPLSPASSADATFATNNFTAGQLIGQWAKAKFTAEGKYDKAKVALLDLSVSQVPLDVARDQGFMSGFGFDLKDPNKIGDESDPRIAGHQVTSGNAEGGRTAMETLLQKSPDINLVYAMDEPAAQGAYQAIKAAGKAGQVTIVAIDGGCAAEADVKKGVIAADSMQFPSKMASLGVQAIVDAAKSGTKPNANVDTGVQLITDSPVNGVSSQGTTWGMQNCWG